MFSSILSMFSGKGRDESKSTDHSCLIKGDTQWIAFLSGTLPVGHPLNKLRGMDHILRKIIGLASDEWLDLHVERFPVSSVDCVGNIPELIFPWQPEVKNHSPMNYPKVRQQCGGCPVAVVAKEISFPYPMSVPTNTFPFQEAEYLYINMMPFDLSEKSSLPQYCQQYWPMIEKCMTLALFGKKKTAYLTIDERPVPSSASQRRPGLHVESPGFLPMLQLDKHSSNSKDRYIPGAEHRWGGGLMMRHEQVEGGIFMASNVANTTAVWNCQINNEGGEFIGPHGNIERFRDLLGPCARTLDAGELIWMTDRTPHESLPVPVIGLADDGTPVRRQYFRLVFGTVTAWYADHSTPNPLGFKPPEEVNIIYGNKFTLYPKKAITWSTGGAEGIAAAYKRRQLHTLLCDYGLGHLYERLQGYGVRCVDVLLSKHAIASFNHWGAEDSDDDLPLMDRNEQHGAYYYDFDQINKLVKKLKKTK